LPKISPVIITFQGCDINRKDIRLFSQLAILGSEYNIFVDNELSRKVPIKRKYSIIPYGIDLKTSFFPRNKNECRKELGIDRSETVILFASSFDRIEKNYPLAKKAINLLGDAILIELGQGYSVYKINQFYNACDVLLLTSVREGSPQVIKEAMACNCPIVSTDVGDVKDVIGNTEGCYITSYDPEDVAEKIKKAIAFGKRTRGRNNIQHLESSVIADKIIEVYKKVLG